MTLEESLLRHGTWLFRWRSLLPFLLFPLIVVALPAAAAVEPHATISVYAIACLLVSASGAAIRGVALAFARPGGSGRRTNQPAARVLNSTGVYSVVRHPLYLGNYLLGLGFFSVLGLWWVDVIYTLAFWIYYERIAFAEEAILIKTFGDEYREWAKRTPCFIPRLRGWQRPSKGFSLRMLLRREYSTWCSLSLAFLIIELMLARANGHWWVHPFWIILAAVTGVAFLVLRTLKKHTKLLYVARDYDRNVPAPTLN